MCVQVAARSRLLPACIALEGSRREVRFDNLNAICMKVPVLYVLGRTEPELRNLRRMRLICSFDIERSLADFRLTSIVSENILQEPSDVLCHGNLLIVWRDAYTAIKGFTHPCCAGGGGCEGRSVGRRKARVPPRHATGKGALRPFPA